MFSFLENIWDKAVSLLASVIIVAGIVSIPEMPPEVVNLPQEQRVQEPDTVSGASADSADTNNTQEVSERTLDNNLRLQLEEERQKRELLERQLEERARQQEGEQIRKAEVERQQELVRQQELENQRILAEQQRIIQEKQRQASVERTEIENQNNAIYSQISLLENQQNQIETSYQEAISILQRQKTLDLESLERLYNQTLESLRSDYASRGLYSSGARIKAEKDLLDAYNSDKQSYINYYDSEVNSRTLEKNNRLATINTQLISLRADLLRINQ